MVSAPAGVGGGAAGRGDRDDPSFELKPSWVAAPQNCSNDCAESLHFYTGRNTGPERESDVSEVTQQGHGGAQHAFPGPSARDSGACAGVGVHWVAFPRACFLLLSVVSTFPFLSLLPPSACHPLTVWSSHPPSALRDLGQLGENPA